MSCFLNTISCTKVHGTFGVYKTMAEERIPSSLFSIAKGAGAGDIDSYLMYQRARKSIESVLKLPDSTPLIR